MPPAPAAARSRRVYEDRPGCPSPSHGARVSYEDYGCRCPDSEAAYRADCRAADRRAKLRAANLAPSTYVESVGTARRLQALAAAGYGSGEIAALVGSSPRHIRRLRADDSGTLRRDLAERIAKVYKRLPPRPESTHSTRLAADVARYGWQPPAHWEGVDIDDPAAGVPQDPRRCVVCDIPMVPHRWRGPVPEGYARHRGRGLCRSHYEAAGRDGTRDAYTALRRDADWVLDAWVVFREEGTTIREAAEALDMHPSALDAMLKRARERGDDRGLTRRHLDQQIGGTDRLCLDCDAEMVSHHLPRPDGFAVHAGRGLCKVCYDGRRLDGTLIDVPRTHLSADDLLDEWAELREAGMTVHEFARQLGRNHLSVRQALLRARRRGDERGVIPERCRRDEQTHQRFVVSWADMLDEGEVSA